MERRYSIATWYVRVLTDFSEECGVPAPRLFASCGVDPAILDDPDARISCHDFLEMCCFLQSLHPTPHLGLRLGQRMQHRYLGAYGFVLMSCSTTRELLDQFSRYSMLANNAGQVRVEERDGLLIQTWRGAVSDPASAIFLDELVLASWTSMGRRISGRPDIAPLSVSFRHSRPEDIGPYYQLFRCELKFSAAEATIISSARDLDARLPQGDPRVREILSALCERLLKQLGSPLEPEWLTACRRAIVEAFRNGEPDIARVAAALELSPATLRQRFKDQSLRFRTFNDELRHELALSYLADPQFSLVDVAYLLGFSEQSAFQRAFKRWTGITPGEHRRNLSSSKSAPKR
ncbi:MAG TPA: AraC family transcriptional regulator [Rubrivivax sp.]|nr:AraC family transcriptional regulator [Rubrivivax sp.]